MAWWRQLIPRTRWWWPREVAYEVRFRLYSEDGTRGAEVRGRRNGFAYFVEQEWVEGTTFKDRGQGQEFGPYDTPEAAEAAAVSRPWFNGETS
jgi:hypothetical protein